MLYFAYGSNLNHHQMKKDRCVGSKFLQSFTLKDYKLVFSHSNKLNKFGYANVIKKKGSKVIGAIWKITKKHEIILDGYENFPDVYQKEYFKHKEKENMFYKMKKLDTTTPIRPKRRTRFPPNLSVIMPAIGPPIPQPRKVIAAS